MIIVKLHFKDGRIQEEQIPDGERSEMFKLFSQVFYRLVDENGNTMHVFQARQNSENADSSVYEYDEVEFTRNLESDDLES